MSNCWSRFKTASSSFSSFPRNTLAGLGSMVPAITVGVKNWPDDFKIMYGAPGRESLSWENRCKRMFSTLKDEGIL